MRRALLLTLSLAFVGVLAEMQTGCAAPASNLPPRTIAAQIEKEWRADLRTGAVADPKMRFASPSRAVLFARLRRAETRYGFRVVKVEMLHPRQAAPLVVVRSNEKRALARATSAILRLLDPKANTGDDRTGWAYEGFLFKALDGRGVPFLLTFNHWRGPNAGGGQWDADESLYPFRHG